MNPQNLYTEENKDELPPFNCFYYQINSPFEEHLIKRLIGKEGYYFKNITQKFKLRYVWFNKEKKQIEIWSGNKNIFPIVHKYILNRLYDICQSNLQQGQELSELTKNWFDKYERQ